MQDNQKDILQVFKRLFKYLKWIIPLIFLGLIYWKLKDTFSSDDFLSIIKNLLQQKVLLTLLLLLAFANWGLEALKWKTLIHQLEIITFFKSYQSILMGLGISLTIPRSIGEIMGRLLAIKTKGREAVVGALLVSRLSQLSTSLLGGLWGLIYFFSTGIFPEKFNKVLWGSIVMLIGIGVVSFILFRLSKKENKVTKYITTIKTYEPKTIVKVWLLAVLRFAVYSSQYVLLIYFLTDGYSFVLLLSSVLIVYLMKSVVLSTSALSDEIVRQASAVWVLSLIGVSEEVAIISTASIWLFNLLLPSLLGICFLPSAKVFIDKNQNTE